MTTWADDAAAALDGLGDSPTPVEARAVTDRYPNVDVLAALASRSGGGGGGGPTLLGPFAVPFDDPGVNNTSVLLTALDEGTIVLRVFAIPTADYLCGDYIEVTASITDAEESVTSEIYRVDNYIIGIPAAPGGKDLMAVDRGPAEDGVQRAGRANIARVPGEGWTLRAYIYVNGAATITAGSVDFYALVQPA